MSKVSVCILMRWCVLLLHQCIVLLLAAAQSTSRNRSLERSPQPKWRILPLESDFRDTALTARKKRAKIFYPYTVAEETEVQRDEVGGFRYSKRPEVFSGASTARDSLTSTSWNPQSYETRVTHNRPCVKSLACASIYPSVHLSTFLKLSEVCF